MLLIPDSNEGSDAANVGPPSLCCSAQLPGWAARRGSLHIFGDPLTPGIPSRGVPYLLESIYRKLESL